jgi:hypothetical protein
VRVARGVDSRASELTMNYFNCICSCSASYWLARGSPAHSTQGGEGSGYCHGGRNPMLVCTAGGGIVRLLVGALGWQGWSVAGQGRLERLAEAATADAGLG